MRQEVRCKSAVSGERKSTIKGEKTAEVSTV